MAPSGKIIATSFPAAVSEAAISDPMKPPPITATRRPSTARSRR
jgi:hypothetical protein